MARDGLLFRGVAVVHDRFRTPHRAIVLQAAWSSVLVITGTYRALFTRVIYTEWIFFGLLAVGLVVLRRRPGVERGYSVWGYPWVPVIFALSAFAIVVNQLLADPRESLVGLAIVAAGLPAYWWMVRSRKPPPMERGTA
jgi:APA family basic amino acid/polyamine antiporter